MDVCGRLVHRARVGFCRLGSCSHWLRKDDELDELVGMRKVETLDQTGVGDGAPPWNWLAGACRQDGELLPWPGDFRGLCCWLGDCAGGKTWMILGL